MCNFRVADHLGRAHWVVRKLSSNAPEVVLSDLPLAPDVVFFVTHYAVVAEQNRRIGEKALVHELNAAGVGQAGRYVFSTVEHSADGWLSKRLRQRAASEERGV